MTSLKTSKSFKSKSRATGRRVDLKPYGFCCERNNNKDVHRDPDIQASLASLRSLHECPALRLLAQEIVKRPRHDILAGRRSSRSSLASRHSSSAGNLALGLQGLGPMHTESELEAAIDVVRRQRQAEYEQRMDRWAAIAERRLKKQAKASIKKCLTPCWYTEFSQPQLKQLRRLEDAMLKDKEERTTNRTWDCLNSMGMITETANVQSKVIRKLLVEFSDNPIRFLCEIYKAVTGSYFEEEVPKDDYLCHERIILSGIAFLELPKIIVELHKRLPPVEKWSFPPKPPRPMAVLPKKMESPLLENIRLPVNWRLYATKLFEWQKKCRETMRPVAILPKNIKTDEEVTFDEDSNFQKFKQNDVKFIQDKKIETKKNMKRNLEKNIKLNSKVNNSNTKLNKKLEEKNKSNDQSDIKIVPLNENNMFNEQELYPLKTDWTNPPTACPYKYRKLLNEKGPLNTDAEFFTELKLTEKKQFPSGRENLSPHMQSFLLDVETDLFKLTQEADRITGAVNDILREIHQSEETCDPCCACRQTKKQHIKWHATKAPHTVIEGITTDENNPGKVIGAVTLHSPASSLSSLDQPPCIPSSEKMVKNKIITGATTMTDGEVVNLVEGVSKTLDHVAREFLHSEAVKEIRNVPPCGCHEETPEEELMDLYPTGKKYEGVCFGKKFRPDQIRAYDCPEFGEEAKVTTVDDCGCDEEVECLPSNDCFDDFEEREVDDEFWDYLSEQCSAYLDVKPTEKAGDKRRFCKTCGKMAESSCTEKFSKKRASDKSKAKKIRTKCSCDSLSQFLELDITKFECVMPEKQFYKRESQNDKGEKKVMKTVSKTKLKIGSSKGIRKKSEMSQKSRIKRDGKRAKPTRKEKRKERISENNGKIEKTAIKKSTTKKIPSIPKKASVLENTVSCPTVPENGGPYGYRTKSEEALPAERTIAYLTKLHPPDHPAEMIPVRQGGRPCRCRENRNRRKKLIYNIGAVTQTPDGLSNGTEPVLDGVYWLTPVPSIRRSDEYVPEYELRDSPYGRPGRNPRDKTSETIRSGDEDQQSKMEDEDVNEAENHSEGWENALKDTYLTEFFTKKRGRGPCGDKCSKCKKNREPRQLKVMKPVCECKYERKIVKNSEKKKHWIERQKRLKTMGKESFLHITEISKSVNNKKLSVEDNYDCEYNDDDDAKSLDLTVIASVTMQTPCSTPVSGRSRTNLPFVPLKDHADRKIEEISINKNPESKFTNLQTKNELQKIPAKKLKGKNKSTSKDQSENALVNNKKSDMINEEKDDDKLIKSKDNAVANKNENKSTEENTEIVHKKVVYSPRRRSSLLDSMEENLKNLIRDELKKMAEENFVTVKLPNYHEMPQILYWISYRIRGMHFTEIYKKKLMEESVKTWLKIDKKQKSPMYPESFEISKQERRTLDFDRALYWKGKIRKKQLEFYKKLRCNVVSFGCTMWRTMEYGKFPNILFKQAFFTYFPAREKDAFVFRSV